MKYYLGIDGGGTKTNFVLIDENQKVIKRCTLGPSAIDTVGIQQAYLVLKSGIKSFNKPITACFAGIGGIGGQDIEPIKEMIKEILPDAKIGVGTDSTNAIISAFGFNDGVAVICGTGSVAFGKWKGKYCVAGGYGYHEGDPGSAFSLGIGALKYLAKVMDGRKTETDFSDDLSKAVGCYSHGELCEYFKDINRTEIAKLAKIVTKHESDENAKKIIENSADELIEEIIAITKRLGVNNECEFSIIGSLGNAETYFKTYLIKKLSNKMPILKYHKYLYEPDVASAMKAMLL
ncbi:MAG TPA: hypothetical protein DCO89_01645 [Clostridiales bacterium]|nr:hypothetical protein [Clostridiales bacterium]